MFSESCAHVREDVGEALTGAHMGGVLSREINRFPSRRCRIIRKAKFLLDVKASAGGAGAVGDLQHVWKLHAREPGDPVFGQGRWQVQEWRRDRITVVSSTA